MRVKLTATGVDAKRVPTSGSPRAALLKWLLLATIVVSGAMTIVTVAINASASSGVRSAAERSLLIAEMQSAVQVESEVAAVFVAQLPDAASQADGSGARAIDGPDEDMESEMDMESEIDDFHSDDPSSGSDLTDHPEIITASESFSQAATELRNSGWPGDGSTLDTAINAHGLLIETIVRLNQAAHNGDDAMSLYHDDTQTAEAELRSSLQELREEVSSALAEAVDETGRSQTLLSVILPVAAIAGLTAAIGFVRSRAVWRRLHFLEELMSAKDQFIGTVSHELRTPLAAIVGFAGLLGSEESGLDEEEKREYLSLILTQGNEVASIVEDLLVGARAEIGQLAIADKPVDVAAQLRQVTEALAVPQDSFAISGPELHARGDPGRVRQILRNLLTNADRYGGERKRVELGAENDMAVIKVIDDGKPIPIEDRERIFEPYTTLKDARPATGSIGLGLAVSRQLAVLMAGDLSYEYHDGHSIFTLTLPLIDEDDELSAKTSTLVGREVSAGKPS